MVLMGIDAEDGGVNGHGPIDNYVQVVDSVLSKVSNGNSGGLLVIGGGKSSTDNVTSFWNAIAAKIDAGAADGTAGEPVTYVNGASNISAQSFTSFEIIGVVSSANQTPSGGLTSAENDALAARDSDVANFVNLGGGLVGFEQSGFAVPFDYVGALGTFQVSTVSQYSDITPTPEGTAIGVTDALDVCCWHQVFDSYPDYLDVLATETGSGRVAALGGQVLVPPPAIPNKQTIGACAPHGYDHALSGNGVCATDPVNTATGTYEAHVTDLSLPGIGLPFSFTRSYSSADAATAGPLGAGWTHSHAVSLTVAANGDVTLRGEGGQQVVYVLQADGTFDGATGARSTLVSVVDGYELTRKDQGRYRFDTSGRLLWVADRNGNQLSYAYDAAGNLATITDTVGRAVTLTHDTSGHLTQVALPDGRAVSYGFTGDLLTSVADVTGASTSYAYDTDNRLTGITDANAKTLVSNSYGADGRVSEQLDALGNRSTFAWDATTQTATMTDARGNAWKWVYSNNVLIESSDPLGNTTRYDYDADTNLTVLTDARGNTSTMDYDAAGNLTSRTAPSPLSYVESFTWDARNNLTGYTDGRGNTTSLGYDTAGNLTSVTEPGNVTTTFTRDTGGRGLLVAVTGPRGKTTSFDYDTAGNLIKVTSPAGEVTSLGYDGPGRLTSLVDPRGNVAGADPSAYTTTFAYDAVDRLTGVTDPLGHATTWSFDSVGSLTSRTDANNHTTSYGYDAARRLTKVTAADATVTGYTYDAVGNLLSRIDPNNHTTSYSYDAANRPTSVTDPLGGKGTYSYDANGNVTAAVDAAGNATVDAGDGTTAYSYDVLNRLTGIDYSDATPDANFGYDANSNRTSLSDGAGTVTYAYDARDLLTEVARGADSFGYAYDAAGNIVRRTYPDASVIDYAYDDVARLATVTQGTATTSYGYDPAGNLTATSLPNGHSETRTYDNAGRLTALRWASSTTTLSDLTYSLDAVGNPTAVTDAAAATTTTHAYDVRDQLVEACFDATCTDHLRYTYDPVGNRLSEARPTGTTTYSYNAADQLTATSGPDGDVAYGYDPNGNQTRAGSHTYAYDLANRLIEVNQPGSDAAGILDAGVYHSLALKSDGTAWAWGYNAYGQLGDGTTTNRTAPVQVSGLTGATSISAGGYHSLAAKSDGTAWAWGKNNSGELGNGTTTHSSVPVQVANLTGITDVDGGSHHSLALKSDGTVWAWGTNSAGQLGDGTTTAKTTPVQVLNLTGVTAIAAGGLSGYAGHNLALLPDGTVWAWGHNNNGQLGDGTTTNRTSPVQVSGLTGVVAVAANGNSSYALKSDGTVWAWGDNSSGQLANTSVKQKATTPVQSNITGVAFIAAGAEHAMAVKNDGTAWAWGNNEQGQLGNGTSGRNASTSTPVQVNTITGVTALAGGHRHSLSALGDGTAWGWGLNNVGQVGDGTTTTRTSPVQITTLASIRPSPSSLASYAYDGDGTRIRTTIDATTTDWLWDPNAPLPLAAIERDSAGGLVRRYTYGTDLLTMTNPDGTFYHHHDRLGSVTHLTDAVGAQQWAYQYEPFGTLRNETQQSASAPTNPMRFTGELFDAETGLYHLRARQYNSATGAFTRPDPLGTPLLWPAASTYAYAQGRPTFFVDHLGLAAESPACRRLNRAALLEYLYGHACAPGGFSLAMGYDPVFFETKYGWRMLDPHGACSAPLIGSTGRSFDFTHPCQTHDYGYDLMRFFEKAGDWRRIADDLFAEDLDAACDDRHILFVRPNCEAWAEVYAAAVKSNSMVHRHGVP